MLKAVATAVRRVRHVWRPPRASWSYRYQLMADQSGPISAIHYLAFQEFHIRNHARFKGAPEPHLLRGVDAAEATAWTGKLQHALNQLRDHDHDDGEEVAD